VSLLEKPEFMIWVSERPAAIQELIKARPPGVPYKVQGGSWPAFIVSYDEHKDGTVGCKVEIEDPKFPRTVFGLKLADLEPMSDEEYHLAKAFSADIEQASEEEWQEMRVSVLKARGIYHDDQTTQ
jgi:hypothetical protein